MSVHHSCPAKSGVSPSFLPKKDEPTPDYAPRKDEPTPDYAPPDYADPDYARHRITPKRRTDTGLLLFIQGRFAESAEDCQRVLKLNPYHVGAIGGLAQCQIQLNQPHEALRTLRRAAKLQPHSQSIRENIQILEAQIESDETR